MLKTFLITTAAVALFAATAHATILFSPGNSPTGSEQNVMFESGATTPALSVTGDTNQTNTPVTFSTLTGQMIRAQGIGQANIVCASGCFNAGSNNTNMQLTSLDMKMGAGFGATDIVANPDFGEGTMQVAHLAQQIVFGSGEKLHSATSSGRTQCTWPQHER